MIVYNNNAWGVWTSGASRGAVRAQHMYLFQENLRYEKIAEALGCNGEYVTSPDQMTPALERAYKLASDEGISTLINCQGKKNSGRTSIHLRCLVTLHLELWLITNKIQ